MERPTDIVLLEKCTNCKYLIRQVEGPFTLGIYMDHLIRYHGERSEPPLDTI